MHKAYEKVLKELDLLKFIKSILVVSKSLLLARYLVAEDIIFLILIELGLNKYILSLFTVVQVFSEPIVDVPLGEVRECHSVRVLVLIRHATLIVDFMSAS